MTPHSIELRERAVNAYLGGVGSYDYVAGVFDIGSASLKRWVSRKRSTGSVAPAARRYGPEPTIKEKGLSRLNRILTEKSDLTLEELRTLYNRRRKTPVSVSTIGRAVRDRLELPRKKRATVRHSRMNHVFNV